MSLWRLRFGGRPTPNHDEWVQEILRHIRDNQLDAVTMLEWVLNREPAETLVEIAKDLPCAKCREPLGAEIRPRRDYIPSCHQACSCPGCGGPALDDPENETCIRCYNRERFPDISDDDTA